ncbi:MAG: hypothetical protein ACTSPO_15995, partial [Candidatus Heimdallarchaeaceae archaeon]
PPKIPPPTPPPKIPPPTPPPPEYPPPISPPEETKEMTSQIESPVETPIEYPTEEVRRIYRVPVKRGSKEEVDLEALADWLSLTVDQAMYGLEKATALIPIESPEMPTYERVMRGYGFARSYPTRRIKKAGLLTPLDVSITKMVEKNIEALEGDEEVLSMLNELVPTSKKLGKNNIRKGKNNVKVKKGGRNVRNKNKKSRKATKR